MESHQPQKNQASEGRPESRPPRQRRFRIVKLEERIAPRKSPKPTYTRSHAPTCYWGCNYSMTNCHCGPW